MEEGCCRSKERKIQANWVKRLFLDTDVLIDYLSDRQPFNEFAGQLFSTAIKQKWVLYVSAISFDNIYYVLRRNGIGHLDAIRAIKKMNEFTSIVTIDADTIHHALNSEFKDFEDAIQYSAALQVGAVDFFITRNTKDYKRSEIQILSPELFLANYY